MRADVERVTVMLTGFPEFEERRLTVRPSETVTWRDELVTTLPELFTTYCANAPVVV